MTTYPAKKLKRVEKTKRCVDCGNPIVPDAMFCLECHAKLEKADK